MVLDWKLPREEAKLVDRIIGRVKEDGLKLNVDLHTLSMDITATHKNGCPLDLQKLLDFPADDFEHDIFGIVQYIDRNSGKLTQCFDPRCSLPEPVDRNAPQVCPHCGSTGGLEGAGRHEMLHEDVVEIDTIYQHWKCGSCEGVWVDCYDYARKMEYNPKDRKGNYRDPMYFDSQGKKHDFPPKVVWDEERSHWDEVEGHPVEDWRTEVANDDTRLGYLAWVDSRKEQGIDG